MHRDAVLVLDCGATNLRSIAVDQEGRLLAQATRPNATVPDPGRQEMRIWDTRDIWDKLCSATREVVSHLPKVNVRGVTVATWGADGAPVRHDGSPTYPVISWQCSRTEPLAREFHDAVGRWDVYRITGYQIMAINTLFKLIWLRRNYPEALDDAESWLMMPGLIASMLGARPHVDPTSASTTMALDLRDCRWSERLLEEAGLGPGFFPKWCQPGENVGEVADEVSSKTGLPRGTPILAGGHDTQFALIGAGAGPNDAILSSGTWEILSVRSPKFEPNKRGLEGGLIFEADAIGGLYDPQILMMGSGVLEWVKTNFFPDIPKGDYDTLIRLGSEVQPGSGGLIVVPSFVSDSGPTRRHGTKGTVLGLQLGSGREDIYRATLEGLSCQLRHALETLTDSTGETPTGIRVVGGGSRNDLWNQIRADVTGLRVTTTSHKEATVLGAAAVGFVGIGMFDSIESAMRNIDMETREFLPGRDTETYSAIYERYRRIPAALERPYKSG